MNDNKDPSHFKDNDPIRNLEKLYISVQKNDFHDVEPISLDHQRILTENHIKSKNDFNYNKLDDHDFLTSNNIDLSNNLSLSPSPFISIDDVTENTQIIDVVKFVSRLSSDKKSKNKNNGHKKHSGQHSLVNESKSKISQVKDSKIQKKKSKTKRSRKNDDSTLLYDKKDRKKSPLLLETSKNQRETQNFNQHKLNSLSSMHLLDPLERIDLKREECLRKHSLLFSKEIRKKF